MDFLREKREVIECSIRPVDKQLLLGLEGYLYMREKREICYLKILHSICSQKIRHKRVKERIWKQEKFK